ncbi:MAG TPA: hypothetical protein VG435_00420 [Acidimicrobiales bacterium]|jgi:hypothetical protein|nr:hypothetical protein [Acidimicrobiales bacterium]
MLPAVPLGSVKAADSELLAHRDGPRFTVVAVKSEAGADEDDDDMSTVDTVVPVVPGDNPTVVSVLAPVVDVVAPALVEAL